MELLLVNTAVVGLLLLIYVTAVFLIAQLKHDNSIMDIAYGPAFFVSLIGAAILTDTSGALPAAVLAGVGIWSARLSSRILRKNWGKPEDARYAKWREAWLERGRLYFLVRSYLQINLLQGAIILLVALPGIIALTYPTPESNVLLLIGSLVFLFGLSYETVADWQLDRFIAHKKAGATEKDLMTEGLFRYSRRPNYFGESLVWWGLAIMVAGQPFGYLAFVSPLLITYIVTKVTGPMLEQSFLEKFPEKYQAYMDQTSYFIPLPPKSADDSAT
jgi:steroid 5-alpha reductase family enzyme